MSKKKIFVSGCYDPFHAEHIAFFLQAKKLGNHLTVSMASDEALWVHKKRQPFLPEVHREMLIRSLREVNQVVIGRGKKLGLDFEEEFLKEHPDVLAVTEDDKYEKEKRILCDSIGAHYVVLPRRKPLTPFPVHSTDLLNRQKKSITLPLRIDFAGGWLDVPSLALKNSFIVNCAITPLVSLKNWRYHQNSGLGGSAAWALLNGKNGITEELSNGVGWQDPAVIQETGLCVWESGPVPKLVLKRTGDFLSGCLALYWTESRHNTVQLLKNKRNYALIAQASQLAHKAVLDCNIQLLADATKLSYEAQIQEGMNSLPFVENSLACKYCGSGWGGYALYLFPNKTERDNFTRKNENAISIEPFFNTY